MPWILQDAGVIVLVYFSMHVSRLLITELSIVFDCREFSEIYNMSQTCFRGNLERPMDFLEVFQVFLELVSHHQCVMRRSVLSCWNRPSWLGEIVCIKGWVDQVVCHKICVCQICQDKNPVTSVILANSNRTDLHSLHNTLLTS